VAAISDYHDVRQIKMIMKSRQERKNSTIVTSKFKKDSQSKSMDMDAHTRHRSVPRVVQSPGINKKMQVSLIKNVANKTEVDEMKERIE